MPEATPQRQAPCGEHEDLQARIRTGAAKTLPPRTIGLNGDSWRMRCALAHISRALAHSLELARSVHQLEEAQVS